MAVAATSWLFCDFGLCTLWQVAHDRFRDSCALPVQPACVPRLWHVMHVSLISAGFIAAIFLMCPFGSVSESTCACPGPWQLSQPRAAAGERGWAAWPCAVPLSDATCGSWHSSQVSLPA